MNINASHFSTSIISDDANVEFAEFCLLHYSSKLQMETPLHSSGSSYHRVSSFPSPFHVAAFWLLEIAGLVLFRCFLSDCWMCAACSPWQPLTAQEQNSISLRLSSPTLLASPVQHPRLFRLFLLPPLQRCQFEGACLIEWATFIFMCGSVCSSRSESTSSHSFIKECWMRKRTAWAVLCDFWLSHLSSLFFTSPSLSHASISSLFSWELDR